MHTSSVSLYLGAYGALGTIAQPLNATLIERSLVKRVDPKLNGWDPAEAGALAGAFSDMFQLVATARFLNQQSGVYQSIYLKYLRLENIAPLMLIWENIIPNYQPPSDLIGGAVMAKWEITTQDWLGGTRNDLCAQGADAYTRTLVHDNNEFAQTHVCDDAFDTRQLPARLSDLSCDDFKGSDGKYHMTEDTDVLGSTLLHEFMHYNFNGQIMGLKDTHDPPDPEFPLIGDPYNGLKGARDALANNLPVVDNADSYAYLVNELYWTNACADLLRDQGGVLLYP